VDVAILGNGAYDPWIANHASPEQVWEMYQESGARYLVPVHWDTFRLGKEPLGDAMRRLEAAAGARASEIAIREIGGTWTMPLRLRR
jgi:L-ascorbate metabolism protein UlaG (beta-lactamase superfamily)